MKTVYQVFASLLALLLLQAYIGEAISCYHCDFEKEKENESCDSDKVKIIDCNSLPNGAKYKFCRKMEMWVDFKVNDLEPIKRILRQCAIDEEPGKPCYYKAGLGGRVNVCHCDSDGCNEAHTLTIMHSVLIVPLLAMMYKYL